MANTFREMSRSGVIKRSDTGMFIGLDDIHIKPGFNKRIESETKEKEDENLFQHLLSGKAVPPLEVIPREDGGVWIVEGHRRTAAFLRVRDTGKSVGPIPIVPFKGNDVDRLARQWNSNKQLALTDFEKSLIAKEMRGLNLTSAEIAKEVNVSISTVEMLLAIGDANRDVQELVKSGDVAPSAAVARVKEHGESAGEVLKFDVEKAKAEGKKRVTKSMVTQPQFSAKRARQLVELLYDAIPIIQGDHHLLMLRDGIKDDVMKIIQEYKDSGAQHDKQ